MTSLEQRNKKISEFHREQMDILNAKGADYTGGKDSEDGHMNFKEVARRLEGAPMSAMTVWAVWFLKHVISVETFIKTGRAESEGMEGRFNDIANYANIGRTLLEEQIEAEREAEDLRIVEEFHQGLPITKLAQNTIDYLEDNAKRATLKERAK